MAKIKAKKKDNRLSVKVKLQMGEKLDDRGLEQFSVISIRGLLKLEKNKKRIVCYSGPMGISLYEKLMSPIGKFEFFLIMEQFADLFQRMMAVQLDINYLVTDLENIYINEQTKELQFIYFPIFDANETDFIKVMYDIIYLAAPIKNNDMNYMDRFAEFLQQMSFFEAYKIENYIMKEEEKAVKMIKKRKTGNTGSGFMTDKRRDYYSHYDKDDEETALLSDDDNFTTLLDEDEATGLLEESGCNTVVPSLRRVTSNEEIRINKPVFRLGKDKNYCDYVVNDNSAVSRSHADIIKRDNRYYVMDLNSTNKTYLNGVTLAKKEETELKDGDVIKLANEEFVFSID